MTQIKVEKVFSKPQGNGTRYAILSAGDETWYSTFDSGAFEKVGGFEQIQVGDTIDIEWELKPGRNGDFHVIQKVFPVGMSPDPSAQPGPNPVPAQSAKPEQPTMIECLTRAMEICEASTAFKGDKNAMLLLAVNMHRAGRF